MLKPNPRSTESITPLPLPAVAAQPHAARRRQKKRSSATNRLTPLKNLFFMGSSKESLTNPPRPQSRTPAAPRPHFELRYAFAGAAQAAS
jgi:hypothetical protein